jgi:hypothetical protein
MPPGWLVTKNADQELSPPEDHGINRVFFLHDILARADRRLAGDISMEHGSYREDPSTQTTPLLDQR